MANLTLLQFWFSHYSEKARWTLDFKGLDYETRTFLPGPHARHVRRLSGQTAVPVLRADGEVIAGSTRIMEWIEARYPEPSLTPADPALAEHARALQTWFDESGADGRRALLSHFLQEPTLMADVFAVKQPAWKKYLYRLIFGARVKGLRERRELGEQAVREGERRIGETLDRIESERGEGRYLVGDRFSLADLTAAALLFPIVLPPELPFDIPHGEHPLVVEWLAKWAHHPATAWISDMYREHRRRAPG